MPEKIPRKPIRTPEQEKEREEKRKIFLREIERKYNVHAVKNLSEEELKQILKIEQESFPEEMQSDLEDLKETLLNKKGIQIIARDEKGKIVSCLSSKPLSDAYRELKDYDPELTSKKNVLYVESIATFPEVRNIRLFFDLLNTLKNEAKKKGFKKIVCHARIENGLSEFLQKRGAKKLRTLEDWHDFGEPFDYLEIEI